jgi:hypothetical protein
MATTQDVHAPTLGAQGEPCAGCGAPLAADQRYCLECGARRPQARIAFRETLARPSGPPRAPVMSSYEERTPPSGIAFLVGLVCLLLALGVGVLIGRSGNESPTAAATTPPPQVISVGGAAPVATTPAATTSTPATTTASPASGKAKSSSGSSAGSKSSKATNKSLKDLSNSSGQDYEKKSSKLPKQVSTGGKAPPKDNKPAGGGTNFEDIG